MLKKLFFLAISPFTLLHISQAKLNVVATTTDVAALVKLVGQSQVEVFAIAKGTQDAHQIEAKPSYMVKFREADLVIAHGLELESGWLVPLIQGSRNSKISAANGSVLELAGQLDPLEIPSATATRADGDLHAGGNPHFQLDPIRLGQAAIIIAKRMGDLDPSGKNLFEKNAADFSKSMVEKSKIWQSRITKSGQIELITYHKYFTYFCDRFGLKCNIQLEPKPGIPPTASHLLEVIRSIKKKNIKVVLIENFYGDAVAAKLKLEFPNLIVERVPVSVEGEESIKTNDQLIERLVTVIEKAK